MDAIRHDENNSAIDKRNSMSLKRNRKFLSNKTNDCEFLETCFLSSGVFNLRSKLQAINHKGQSHVRCGDGRKWRLGQKNVFLTENRELLGLVQNFRNDSSQPSLTIAPTWAFSFSLSSARNRSPLNSISPFEMNTRTAASIIDSSVSLSFHVLAPIPPKSAFPGRRLARFRSRRARVSQAISQTIQLISRADAECV